MSWNSRVTLILVFHVFQGYSYDFEITVPSVPQLAIHGHQVTLDCTFPVGNKWDPWSTVVTWQRGQEVVHSFYHGRDQLDRQSARYAKRTSLFHSEMERGNATLRLERTNLGDSGDYTCAVNTLLGNQKKTFPLKLAALYLEPHLNVKASPSGVELLVTSHGGYPVPTVQWLDDSGEDVTNDTNTHFSRDTLGLYALTSSLSVQGSVNRSVTFLLNNDDLGQAIRREYTLQIEPSEGLADRARWCVVLSLLLLLLLVILVAVFVFRRKNAPHNTSKEIYCKDNGLC